MNFSKAVEGNDTLFFLKRLGGEYVADRAAALTIALSSLLTCLATPVSAIEFIALSQTNNGLYSVKLPLDATTVTPRLIGVVENGGDAVELIEANATQLYTFDRDSNSLIVLERYTGTVLKRTPLDQDLVVTHRGFDMSPNGVLYGVLPSMQLRTINPLTGQTTFIANITGAARIEAIVFAPDGTLYASGSIADNYTSETLFTLSPVTGELTAVGLMGEYDVDDLTYGSDGFLYGVNSVDGVETHLLKIYPTTASVEDLGSMGVTAVTGLLAVPDYEPRVMRVAVDADSSNALYGEDWANATNLQRALELAQPNDEIWLKKGVYYPDEGQGQTDNDRNSSFEITTDINIYGGFDGTETERSARLPESNLTILSGDIDQNDTDSNNDGIADSPSAINGNNAYCLLYSGSSKRLYIKADGIIITGGYADNSSTSTGWLNKSGMGSGLYTKLDTVELFNCKFINCFAIWSGAIFPYHSSLSLHNCIFENNRSIGHAPVIYFTGPIKSQINDCIFRDNMGLGNTTSSTRGGAIRISGSGVDISNSHFLNNRGSLGGAIHISAHSSGYKRTTTILGCTFNGNTASQEGGAVYLESDISPFIKECTFSENTASLEGGAISCHKSTPFISRCQFQGNTSTTKGGAAYITQSTSPSFVSCLFSGNQSNAGGAISIENTPSAVLTNCTIAGNKGIGLGGGIICDVYSYPYIINTVIWGNEDISGSTTASASIKADFFRPYSSLIQSHAPVGNGNLNGTLVASPRFSSPVTSSLAPTTTGDYQLLSDSPLIAKARADVDLDQAGAATSILADQTLDVVGNSRFVGLFPDIGAYEFQYNGDADFDDDGIPDDLEILETGDRTSLTPENDDDGDNIALILELLMGLDYTSYDYHIPQLEMSKSPQDSKTHIQFQVSKVMQSQIPWSVLSSTDLGITDAWKQVTTTFTSAHPIQGDGLTHIIELEIDETLPTLMSNFFKVSAGN